MAAIDTDQADLKLLLDTVQEAGEIGLTYFRSQNEVRYKSGNSPVTQADTEIDTFLRRTFAEKRSDYGWLSEETADTPERLDRERVVIADPIDGTRGFINGSEEWCISVAIVEDEMPVVAVLHCPALGQTFSAIKGQGVSVTGLDRPQAEARDRHRVTGSKKLIEVINEIPDSPFEATPFIPSLAYRLALVSTAILDGAFARPGASEWDVAAADLLLTESASRLTTPQGAFIRYNQKNIRLPGLIASGNALHGELMSLANSTGIFQ